MSALYTALSIKQYSQLLKTKNLSPIPLDEYGLGIIFTEDRQYWIEKIKEQADLEDDMDYQYAVLLEFQLPPQIINQYIQNKETGRLSETIYEYYAQLGKEITIPLYAPSDKNALCILDIYESSETEDGISQEWLLKVESADSDLWKAIVPNINKISSVGSIPGAGDKAKALLE